MDSQLVGVGQGVSEISVLLRPGIILYVNELPSIKVLPHLYLHPEIG